MNLIHRIEPVLWLLFGAGAFLAAMVLPAVLLGMFILAPLGAFDPEAISHARMVALLANPVGRLIVAALISLVLWHSAHHLRHLALDFGLHSIEAPVSYTLYGLALLGTLAAISTVLSLQPLS